jgi:hypothetical protein
MKGFTKHTISAGGVFVKGANKVKSVSNKDILEAMEDLYRDIPNVRHDDRQMVVMTGRSMGSAYRFELKKLIFELEEMYKSGKVNTKRMKTLTTLLCSEDMSNFEMAKKIMKSL